MTKVGSLKAGTRIFFASDVEMDRAIIGFDGIINRNEQGKTEKDLVMYLGLGNGAFTHWKYENQKSFMIHINQIADFLGVSPNYLLRGIDEPI